MGGNRLALRPLERFGPSLARRRHDGACLYDGRRRVSITPQNARKANTHVIVIAGRRQSCDESHAPRERNPPQATTAIMIRAIMCCCFMRL